VNASVRISLATKVPKDAPLHVFGGAASIRVFDFDWISVGGANHLGVIFEIDPSISAGRQLAHVQLIDATCLSDVRRRRAESAVETLV